MKTPYVLALASLLLMACSTATEELSPTAVQPAEGPANATSEVTLAPFAFTTPLGWEVLSKGAQEVSFQHPSDLTLVMTLTEEGVHDLPMIGETDMRTTVEGIQIYMEIECTTYYCGNLAYEGQAYAFYIDANGAEVDANGEEAIDENLETQLDDFIATVHLAE